MLVAPLAISLVLMFGLDQLTKAMILTQLRDGEAIVFGKLAIRRLINRRMAVPFLSGSRQLLVVWTAEVLTFGALVQFGPLPVSMTTQLALGTALGGAGSNLCDWLCRGGVVDFLDVGFWPVFNLADAAIVVGVALSLVNLWS